MPSSGQNGLRRFVRRTSRPATVSTTLSVSVGIFTRAIWESDRGQNGVRPRSGPQRFLSGASFGGRSPCRTAPASTTYSSSRSARTHRNISPPRLMSPRPMKSTGNRSRSPKIGSSTSTYFPDAMLPSSTISHSGPAAASSAHAVRTNGSRYHGLRRSIDSAANARIASRVTIVSAGRRPAFGVITRTPPETTGHSGSGGRANRRAYASLPRKYKPLTKLKTSPSGAPASSRSCCASGKPAVGETTIRARTPLQLAGDSRKTRGRTTGSDISSEQPAGRGEQPSEQQERHDRQREHERDHQRHERPVAGPGAAVLVSMPFEQCEVEIVRFPREIEEVAQ